MKNKKFFLFISVWYVGARACGTLVRRIGNQCSFLLVRSHVDLTSSCPKSGWVVPSVLSYNARLGPQWCPHATHIHHSSSPVWSYLPFLPSLFLEPALRLQMVAVAVSLGQLIPSYAIESVDVCSAFL